MGFYIQLTKGMEAVGFALGPYLLVAELSEEPGRLVTLDVYTADDDYLDSFALYEDSDFKDVLAKILPKSTSEELEPLLEGLRHLALDPDDWSSFCCALDKVDTQP